MLIQFGGISARWRQWSVSFAHVSFAADTEGGSIPACSSLSTRRHVEDDGQRGHLLRSACSLHLHLQVFVQRV